MSTTALAGLWVADTLQTAGAKEALLTPAVGHTSQAKPSGMCLQHIVNLCGFPGLPDCHYIRPKRYTTVTS